MRHTISFIVIFMLGICGITELGAQAIQTVIPTYQMMPGCRAQPSESQRHQRGCADWIRYDLGRPILCINPNFGTSRRAWTMVEPNFMVIDYSIDGITWFEWAVYPTTTRWALL